MQTTSSTSLASSSGSEITDLTEHHEEELHTTQKETITARRNTLTKAMSNAFSRTLTRMRSRGALNEANGAEGGLVIGVAVHETETEEVVHGDGAGTSRGAETNESTSAQAAEGDDVRPPSTKRASISMRTAEVSVVASSAKTESRSRSGSVNKLRSVLPLRSQSSTSESKPAPASVPATSPTPVVEESPKVEVTDPEGKADEGAKKAKLGRRLSSLAKSFSQTLRRKKSEEKTKEKEKIASKGKSDASLASATTSSTSAENEPPSPQPAPPVPALPEAATVPLPPSPASKPAQLLKKTSSSLLSPDMIPLPASPLTASFSPSVQTPMRIEIDNRTGDKASLKSNATTVPGSPDDSASNSVPILEKLDGVLEEAKEVMASTENLQQFDSGAATTQGPPEGEVEAPGVSKRVEPSEASITTIEERPSSEHPEDMQQTDNTGKNDNQAISSSF